MGRTQLATTPKPTIVIMLVQLLVIVNFCIWTVAVMFLEKESIAPIVDPNLLRKERVGETGNWEAARAPYGWWLVGWGWLFRTGWVGLVPLSWVGSRGVGL
jgi:hypothetical protein